MEISSKKKNAFVNCKRRRITKRRLKPHEVIRLELSHHSSTSRIIKKKISQHRRQNAFFFGGIVPNTSIKLIEKLSNSREFEIKLKPVLRFLRSNTGKAIENRGGFELRRPTIGSNQEKPRFTFHFPSCAKRSGNTTSCECSRPLREVANTNSGFRFGASKQMTVFESFSLQKQLGNGSEKQGGFEFGASTVGQAPEKSGFTFHFTSCAKRSGNTTCECSNLFGEVPNSNSGFHFGTSKQKSVLESVSPSKHLRNAREIQGGFKGFKFCAPTTGQVTGTPGFTFHFPSCAKRSGKTSCECSRILGDVPNTNSGFNFGTSKQNPELEFASLLKQLENQAKFDYHFINPTFQFYSPLKKKKGTSSIPKSNHSHDLSSANEDTSSRTRKIRFHDQVYVIEIPNRHSYASDVKTQMWNNRKTLMDMIKRNKIEQAWECRMCGEALEEKDFQTYQGKLIHPAHIPINSDSQLP